MRLPYVVVAQLSQPIQRLLRDGLPGAATAVAELAYQGDALAAPAPLATLKHWGFLAGNRGGRLAITREGLL